MNKKVPLIIVVFCVLSLTTGIPKEDKETKGENIKENKDEKHDTDDDKMDKSVENEKDNSNDKDEDEKNEESKDDKSKDDESIDDQSESSGSKDEEESKNNKKKDKDSKDHSKIDFITRFSLELFRKVAEEERHHSFSMSALPIWKQLSCLLPGAEGSTKKQLRKVLYHGEEEDAKTELFSPKLNDVLKVYSRIYITEDAKLKEEYSPKKRHRRSTDEEEQDGSGIGDLNRKCDYSTLFKQVDFSNVKAVNKTINHDFDKASHGRFKKVLSKGVIDKKTKILMINAVEFKGKLLESFDEKRTVKKKFYNYKNEKVGTVNMMIKKSIFPYYYSTILGASILELPYENKMSLFIYLPDATDIDAKDMLSKFKDPMKVMKNHSKMNDTKVEVHIPKFKATGNIIYHLKKALKHMGMADIFDRADAKLQGFLEEEMDDFSLNIVSQAFRFAVNEKGSIEGDKVHGSSIKFVCNRPFAFMVIDKETGHPIMTGEFNSPKDIHL